MFREIKKLELSNGETLAYRESGQGNDAIILIHGNMASSQHWDILVEHINPNFKVYAIDLRGYGESTYHHPINDIDDFSQDLKLLVDNLELSSFHLIGWSNGGGVAMQFAAKYPEHVKKMILLSSMSTRGYPLFKKDENGNIIERLETKEQIAADQVLQSLLNAQKRKDKAFFKLALNQLLYKDKQPNGQRYDKYLEEILKQRNMIDVAYVANKFNISESSNGLTKGTGEIRKIECPVLVLWGRYDLMTSEEMTQEIVEDFKNHGKQVDCEYLETGHSPFTDDKDTLLYSIQNFLNAEMIK
ncbi:intracellular short-chain-length polyhydroxyalkanoate depolymerase [Evansella halocellulosilytica]|uniref:intracellular short-chain-length polyhydroxyalkanoate depolymerase n=1 Tax=Evansella halocellulosilytica TaxID=2011013 RepID=UPI000BB688B8|nr:alpha/beta hydrolase [Evansella halocellulosilytica]